MKSRAGIHERKKGIERGWCTGASMQMSLGSVNKQIGSAKLPRVRKVSSWSKATKVGWVRV